MRPTMARLVVLIIAALIVGTLPAGAMIPNQPSAASKANADYMQADALAKKEKFADAIPLLVKVLTADDKNADAHSLLSHCLRMQARPNESRVPSSPSLQLSPQPQPP